MPKAQRQHFVPRFYLKGFGDPRLFCFDKITEKSYKANVNDIALDKNFYQLDGLPNREIENFLSENESKFSRAYYEVIREKDISKLSQESSDHFFLFVASQLVRTSGYRLDIENLLSRAYDKVFS